MNDLLYWGKVLKSCGIVQGHVVEYYIFMKTLYESDDLDL